MKDILWPYSRYAESAAAQCRRGYCEGLHLLCFGENNRNHCREVDVSNQLQAIDHTLQSYRSARSFWFATGLHALGKAGVAHAAD